MRILLATLCAVSFFYQSAAWWDEGHMLVGAVARSQMTKEEVDRLEHILGEWDQTYPGLSKLDAVAVWADHVKCSKTGGPTCSGLPRADGMSLFNGFHYTNKVYNPLNLKLEGIEQFYPLPDMGADDLLRNTYRTLTMPKAGGSSVSWNLALRLFVHIFGDIHQPLHACTLISKWHDGEDDRGGNSEKVRSKLLPGVRDLHQVWDSAAGLYTVPWPHAANGTVTDAAAKLVSAYPPSHFASRLNITKFDAIVEDTFEQCTKHVYYELAADFNTPRNFQDDPYEPTQKYIDNAREVSRQQLVLGGYRLAELLKKFAKNAPHDWRPQVITPSAAPVSPSSPPSPPKGGELGVGGGGVEGWEYSYGGVRYDVSSFVEGLEGYTQEEINLAQGDDDEIDRQEKMTDKKITKGNIATVGMLSASVTENVFVFSRLFTAHTHIPALVGWAVSCAACFVLGGWWAQRRVYAQVYAQESLGVALVRA